MSTCECGQTITDGHAFCGACGQPRPTDAAPPAPGAGPATGAMSTPWPAAARRRAGPVDPPTTPMPGGVTSAFPTPSPAATPPPPPSGPPVGAGPSPLATPPPPPRREGSTDRTWTFVLGGLVGLLLIAVLVLSLVVVGGDDGSDREATEGTAPATVAPSSAPSSVAPTSAPTSAPPAPAPTVPPTAASVPPTTAPPTPSSAPSTTEAEPIAPTPVASAEEISGTFEGYVRAIDSGDLDDAYSYVAPSLRAREGWSRDEFTSFWQENGAGAAVVSIDSTSPSSGTLTATVDYGLRAGGVSRESIRARVGAVGEGGLALVDYEVLDSTVLE